MSLIKDLKSQIHVHPDISFLMDVMVVDIPITYGIFLSRKYTTLFGGSLQMDLSYVIIPISNFEMVKIYRDPFVKYHVEDPKEPCNEVVQETISELFISRSYFLTHEDLAYRNDEEVDDQYFQDTYDNDNYDEDMVKEFDCLSYIEDAPL
jgi:hypothetical protein